MPRLLSRRNELKVSSCATPKAASHSTFWTWEIPVLINGSILDAMTFFKGPKTSTLSGWVKCEECGGRIASTIFVLKQYPTHSPVIWLSCSSQIKSRYWLLAFSRVEGSKQRWSHWIPCLLLVQPFVLQENLHSSSTLSAFTKFSPLKIINEAIIGTSAFNHRNSLLTLRLCL